jgi:hypothetical protein
VAGVLVVRRTLVTVLHVPTLPGAAALRVFRLLGVSVMLVRVMYGHVLSPIAAAIA